MNGTPGVADAGAATVKCVAVPGCAQFVTRAFASIEPHPVARSNPTPASYPVVSPILSEGGLAVQLGEPPEHGTALFPDVTS